MNLAQAVDEIGKLPSIEDAPVEVSVYEGAVWTPITRDSKSPVHAIRFASGRIWDAVNGWRE
jgi:hypothetical protein